MNPRLWPESEANEFIRENCRPTDRWPFGQKGAFGQLLWARTRIREIDENSPSRPSTRTAHEGHERVVLIATNYTI